MKCLICYKTQCKCDQKLKSIKLELEQGEQKFIELQSYGLEFDKWKGILCKFLPQFQFARYVYLIVGGRRKLSSFNDFISSKY